MDESFLRGVIVPMLTPFNCDNTLDVKTLEHFTGWLCRQRVDVLFPMGGSGEYTCLTTEERKRIIEIVISSSGERVPVVPGTGGTSLEETMILSLFAQQRGADAVGIVVPGFVEASEEAIFDYFKQINMVLNIPIMIYDPRGSGEHSVTPCLMKRICNELSKVEGIKYRTTDGERMARMVREVGGKVAVLSGVESVFLSDLAVGVVGVVGGGGNLFPRLLAEIQKQFESGDIEAARKAQFRIFGIYEVLDRVSWPLSGKIALHALGVPFKPVVRVAQGRYSEKDAQCIREYFLHSTYQIERSI
jgi:4-hydroxy-tetrahydrodipicolinate synthase